MKRKITEDERKLFQTHVAQAILKPKPQKTKIATSAKAKTGELDGNTAEKLRKGQLAPGARIDLHGMTEAAAHRALRSFLARAQSDDVRLALVITGVGNPKAHEGAEWMRTPHGILKEMVPRWLNEKDFAALTSGWARAHRRHGGDGALYVYLRKIK
ncbi:MAG TPA: Smr/MutS family protein [Rhizomicrobium sp.]|jgi:DNA-nicking Smr family endonuclease|nr:Smr/MutS family protein [Rhizomicrobium sp.]